LLKILVVDDDALNLTAKKTLLEREGFSTVTARSGEKAVELFQKNSRQFALAIIDFKMDGMDGATTARELLKIRNDIFILIHSGDTSQDAAVSSWRAGAVTFIEKAQNSDFFLETVQKWFAKYKDEHETISPRVPLGENEKLLHSIGMEGRSSSLAQLAKLVTSPSMLNADSNVLIVGENGTGKELLARAVHTHSKRKGRPFVTVNCAAIAENLAESSFFGHEKGAFTGADEKKIGFFQAADGGTLFLDEIGETSPAIQAKLLRAIQQKTFTPVGSHREVKVDCRIIAATNRDLMREVRQKNFREDLYYRLAVISLSIAPLRERKEDIEPIVRRLCNAHNRENKDNKCFLSKAVRLLERYSWPGNVRELENVITKVLLFSPNDVVTPADFDDNFVTRIEKSFDGRGLRDKVEDVSKDAILAALKQSGSKREAARMLGIPWSTFKAMVRRLGIESKAGVQ